MHGEPWQFDPNILSALYMIRPGFAFMGAYVENRLHLGSDVCRLLAPPLRFRAPPNHQRHRASISLASSKWRSSRS